MYESISSASTGRKNKVSLLTVTALMTAVTCILAPLSIPIGPVPVTLTNLVLYISLYLLGWKMTVVSYTVYMLIGLAGVPVFSGFSGGPAKLLGPTGGYIIGFIPMAVIAGVIIRRFKSRILQFLAMLLGTAVLYAFGTAWFCLLMESSVLAALGTCVIPFIPGDIIKMLIAILICPSIKSRLRSI